MIDPKVLHLELTSESIQMVGELSKKSLDRKGEARKTDSTMPEVLTATIKREPSYNPDNGDWEYLILNGIASTIVERGKLTRCNGCHSSYERSDFVTTYLPEKVTRELK